MVYVIASGLHERVEPVTRLCIPVNVQKKEGAVREVCFPVRWNCKQAARRGLDPNPNVVKREGGARLMQELRVPRTPGIQGEGVRVVAIGKQAGIHFFWDCVLFLRWSLEGSPFTLHCAASPFLTPKSWYVGIRGILWPYAGFRTYKSSRGRARAPSIHATARTSALPL